MSNWRKGLFVGVGAVVLSTLGLQASDIIQGIESNLLGSVIESTGPCGASATPLLLGERTLCVDIYEASPGELCPQSTIQNESDTLLNINDAECLPVSAAKQEPWRYISFTQAQQLCARAGKRLPTNDEWYKSVSGFGDQSSCVTSGGSNPELTGTANCVSPLGVHDLIGNVWEWIDEEVVDGIYNNRELPPDGYVSAVDTAGVVSAVSNSPQAEYGDDYVWTDAAGVRVMIRGGFYGSGSDAGMYSLNSAVDTSFRAAGVGFRCVQDV